ncbi:26S proteasome regulatory subunit N13, partial [Phenoliferia sp. Uapishka_3]
MAPLLQFKAGKCYRRGDTNWVDPSPNRGLVYLENNPDDDLLHCTPLLTPRVARFTQLTIPPPFANLVMFPGDAIFTTAPGVPRVHVLKFHSSAERHFFWSQDVDSAGDAEVVRKVNELIGAELEMVVGPTTVVEGMEVESEGPAAVPAPRDVFSATPARPAAPTSAPAAESALGNSLRDILANLGGASAGAGATQGFANDTPEYVLPSVLTPSVLLPLLASTPSLIPILLPFLPSSVPQTPESLRTAISSVEFKRSVASLDRALRTGALGPLVRGLGLGEECAMGVGAFLEGVQKQADKERAMENLGESMQE